MDVLSSTSRHLDFCIQYAWPCGCPGEQAVILHPECVLTASPFGKVYLSCCGYVFINMHLLQAGYQLKMVAYRFVFPRPALRHLVEQEPPTCELRAFCSSKGSVDPILCSAWSHTSGGVDPLLGHRWSSPFCHKVAAQKVCY